MGLGKKPETGLDAVVAKPQLTVARAPEKPRERLSAIYAHCFKVTGEFEGKGFSQATGDFDGMGISLGLLQWNYGIGTLQSRILKTALERGVKIDSGFPQPITPTAHMKPLEAVKFARLHMIQGNTKLLKRDWKVAWEGFLLRPEILSIQIERASELADQAREHALSWGFGESPRAIHFFFDVIVQNGSMKGISKPSPSRSSCGVMMESAQSQNKKLWQPLLSTLSGEQMSLFQAAYLRARKSNPEYFADVFSRKATIAIGSGFVHGKLFALNNEYQNLIDPLVSRILPAVG